MKEFSCNTKRSVSKDPTITISMVVRIDNQWQIIQYVSKTNGTSTTIKHKSFNIPNSLHQVGGYHVSSISTTQQYHLNK